MDWWRIFLIGIYAFLVNGKFPRASILKRQSSGKQLKIRRANKTHKMSL